MTILGMLDAEKGKEQTDIMSNKLKTISVEQFEHLISEAVSRYLNEECECRISNLDTSGFDYEDNVGVHQKRKVEFDVELSYKE